MSQSIVLKAKGLKTSPNQVEQGGSGSVTTANNVVVDHSGWFRLRRGIEPLRDANSPYAKLALSDEGGSCTFYKGELIIWCADGRIARWNNDTGATYYRTSGAPSVSGSATLFPAPPSDSIDHFVRFAESNGNLYFTTSTGIKKLDSTTSVVRDAGIPKPAYFTGLPSNGGAGSVFLDDEAVAYRILWGYRDANDNLILGPPSGRLIVTNTLGAGVADVTLTHSAPEGIGDDYFYQVYRSFADLEPNDELRQVWEAPTLPVGAGGLYTVTDTVDDDLVDTPLYSNASQEGILQSNEQPPLARDLALFNGSMVYANLTEKHRLKLHLLSADGTSGGIKTRDSIQIDGIDYLFTNDDLAATWIAAGYSHALVSSNADPYLAIEETAKALIDAVNTDTNQTDLYAHYESLPDELSGKILLEERGVGGSAFVVTGGGYLTAWRQDVPRRILTGSHDWNDSTPKTGVGFIRAGSTVTVKTVTDNHGFSTGDTVVITPIGSADADFPTFTGTITVTGLDTFTYTQAGAAVDHRDNATLWRYSLSVQGTDLNALTSVAERSPNGLAIAKNGRPEAVPLTSRLKVDAATEILRIKVLRDRLYIFKEDGIWVLTGDNPSNYRIDLFDNTTRLLASKSVDVLGNRIFGLTDQGVVALSGDSGVQILSRDIEVELMEDLINKFPKNTANSYCWGVGHEAERKYILHVPNAAGTAIGKAYVYNILTNTWTTQSTTFGAGAVDSLNGNNYLYYCDSDAPNVSRERHKNSLAGMVHSDDAYPVTCTSAGTGTSVTITGTGIASVGDVYFQSTGSLVARITAVVEGGGNSVLTLDTSAAWTTGDRRVHKKITGTIAWAVDSGGNPSILKHYSAAKVFIGACSRFGSLELNFGNELVGVGGDVTLNAPANGQYPVALHTYVPREAQRCAFLEVGLTLSTAFDDPQIHGIGLRFNQGSERFTR